MHGMTKLVEYCLEEGFGVDMETVAAAKYFPRFVPENPRTMTPLALTCAEGQTEMVKLLRKLHSELVSEFVSQCPPNTGHPMLFIAVVGGSEAVVRELLDNRATFVKQLLDLGADYAVAKFNGETALHVGSFRGYLVAIEGVLDKSSFNTDQARFTSFLNTRNDKGKTALVNAAETDLSSIIQLLLKYGADYPIQDNSCFTALHYRAFRDNRASVERLLAAASRDKGEHGQRFRPFLNQGSHTDLASAAHNAAIEGYTKLVDLLLNIYGAEYTCVDINKCIPLHIAVQKNSMPVMEVVSGHAKKDPDVQRFHDFLLMRDKDGRTA